MDQDKTLEGKLEVARANRKKDKINTKKNSIIILLWEKMLLEERKEKIIDIITKYNMKLRFKTEMWKKAG